MSWKTGKYWQKDHDYDLKYNCGEGIKINEPPSTSRYSKWTHEYRYQPEAVADQMIKVNVVNDVPRWKPKIIKDDKYQVVNNQLLHCYSSLHTLSWQTCRIIQRTRETNTFKEKYATPLLFVFLSWIYTTRGCCILLPMSNCQMLGLKRRIGIYLFSFQCSHKYHRKAWLVRCHLEFLRIMKKHVHVGKQKSSV